VIKIRNKTINRPVHGLHSDTGEDNLNLLSVTVDSYISQLEKEHELAGSGRDIADQQDEHNLLSKLNAGILRVCNLSGQDTGSERQDDIVLLGLCHKPIKTIIGMSNHLSQPNVVDVDFYKSEIAAAAKNLQFLLRETQDSPLTQRIVEIDPWQMADDALGMLSPILSRRGISVNLKVGRSCPARLNVELEQSKSLLFQFLFHYLQHSGQNNLDLTLDISFVENEELVFSLDEENYPAAAPCSRFQNLINQNITFEDGLLYLPAVASATDEIRPGEGLTGVIICERKLQWHALYERLTQLGVQFTNDFRSPEINFCLVGDETGPVFDEIYPLLGARVSILLLNNNTLYQRSNWYQLHNPVNQREIRQLLARLQAGRDKLPAYSILAVDDNAANLNLLKLQLTQLGHRVTTASNGTDALDLCCQNHFNLMFLDIQMPGMSGVEVAEKLSDFDAPPIIGLTAHVTDEERESYLKSGMSQVLVKPIRNDNLKSVLRRYIEYVEVNVPAVTGQIAEEPIFDRELSLSTVHDRPEIARELFELLISALPEDQEQINIAFGNRDHQALAAAVHKLHGAIRYCGVPRLAVAINKLESLVKTGSDDNVSGALDIVNDEISALHAWQQDNPDPFEAVDSATAERS
tara:strand:- start:25422 stop:27329 length:1908 start_codon:yes stop_codon:yes gene_type:complete